MNITATNVTGTAYVVAVDETKALEAFEDNAGYAEERDAIREETRRNDFRSYDDAVMNTYKITVSAELVH